MLGHEKRLDAYIVNSGDDVVICCGNADIACEGSGGVGGMKTLRALRNK